MLAEQLISYGSCQFPTLGFVVERFKAIQAFVQETFYKIKGRVQNVKPKQGNIWTEKCIVGICFSNCILVLCVIPTIAWGP